MTKDQIKALHENNTPLSDEWNDYFTALVRDMTAAGSIPKSEARRRILELIKLMHHEAGIIDLAETAITALERVEELEKENLSLARAYNEACNCFPTRRESHEFSCPYRNS